MAQPSEEERGFTVVLERIEWQYKVLSEKVTSLDQKIDRELHEVRRDMDDGFSDIRKGIAGLVKQIRGTRNGQHHRS